MKFCRPRPYELKIISCAFKVKPTRAKPKPPVIGNVEVILNNICLNRGILLADLKSQRRFREFVEARMLAVHFIKLYVPNLSLKAIGEHLGGRDHSTIIYLHEKCDDLKLTDYAFRVNFKFYDDLFKKIFIVDVLDSGQYRPEKHTLVFLNS